jgi:hypothetical protein
MSVGRTLHLLACRLNSPARIAIAASALTATVLASRTVGDLKAQTAAASPDAARMSKSREESCITNLRAINQAQALYSVDDTTKGFARSLKQLGPDGNGRIESVLASGKKDGYIFQLTTEPRDTRKPARHYQLSARPVKRAEKGQRSFYTDETGVIRSTPEPRAATATDPPIS